MDQYLLIPLLMGWTSINPSYFDVHQGYKVLTHPHIGHQIFRSISHVRSDLARVARRRAVWTRSSAAWRCVSTRRSDASSWTWRPWRRPWGRRRQRWSSTRRGGGPEPEPDLGSELKGWTHAQWDLRGETSYDFWVFLEGSCCVQTSLFFADIRNRSEAQPNGQGFWRVGAEGLALYGVRPVMSRWQTVSGHCEAGPTTSKSAGDQWRGKSWLWPDFQICIKYVKGSISSSYFAMDHQEFCFFSMRDCT